MATPPKPPKDPKPAARRAPRKAPATSTARRAAAAPPKQAAPATAEAPEVAASKAVASKAAPPKAASAKTESPKRTKAAAAPTPITTAKPPRAKSAPRAKPAAAKSAIADLIPKSIALPKTADVSAAAKVVTETVSRNRWTIGAIVAAAGAGLAAFLTRGRIAGALGRAEGHEPTDLLATGGPGLAKEGDERAIPAFRPDMDAPMTPAEREALRPATGSAPTLVSDCGSTGAQ